MPNKAPFSGVCWANVGHVFCTFSVLFLQVFCEIFIAHTVKIRNTLADQLVFLRVIEKVQCFAKTEMTDLSLPIASALLISPVK